MRLTPLERQTIRAASLRRFGVAPRLFGSRVDDTKRGGDIDLYIEADLTPHEAFEREMKLACDLQLALGEQKIDIVVNTGLRQLPIYDVARREGVWLTHEYPDAPERQLTAINGVQKLGHQLVGWLTRFAREAGVAGPEKSV